MRNTLEDHLSTLRHAGKISTWHDLELEAGTEWEPAILNKLDTADIILLLVSSNFIASKYCYGTELKRAIARHHEGTARVIPIILSSCDWNHPDVPFSKLNVLPTHAEPIISRTLDKEEAFTIVARKIRETVEQLRTQKQDGQSKQQQAVEAAKLEQQLVGQQQQKDQDFQEDLSSDVTLDMVAIAGKQFLMGSPAKEVDRDKDEGPQHRVEVPSFWMGKYAITQSQWFVVAKLPKINRDLNPDPSQFKGDHHPVEQVSWYDAIEFCDRLNRFLESRLSRKTKKTYRLPSEAEWEYACRAGTTTPFHFGEIITPNLANYSGNYTYGSEPKGEYREQTTPVGSFGVANAFGLYDMHGNVWEWCADHWHENYTGAPIDGSAWLTENQNATRLLRGGSWCFTPRHCRSANRELFTPDARDIFVGVRVVCVSSWTA